VTIRRVELRSRRLELGSRHLELSARRLQPASLLSKLILQMLDAPFEFFFSWRHCRKNNSSSVSAMRASQRNYRAGLHLMRIRPRMIIPSPVKSFAEETVVTRSELLYQLSTADREFVAVDPTILQARQSPISLSRFLA